ncbi:trypsin-like serine peptidase [Planomonospora venezuelensis]|uniref:V8-like Glu-specific endopeptidase n=1 Tax=Planomonospora venezuelensis TaxID=1999 RepID=A0A841DE74_PLAVE|nr:peptidase [Planomonospora venezuelensis]MBB5965586.1 V8-like Glu-specific endopeptidase [Planomonospora venezuelensis]GIN05217.1 peptidase [Planomonospora venezuelensis]
MRRTAHLVPILTLVAGSTLLPAAAAHSAVAPTGTAAGTAAAPSTPQPVEEEAADTRSEQRVVQRYWTEAKMEAAQPLDALSPKKNGMRLTGGTSASQPAGAPVSIPPTAADGDTAAPLRADAAARASSGSPWTRGGAVTSTAGRVFFTYQGRNASCSGNAVTSENRSTVITAGHCVKMGGAFHSNWVFVPGYDSGSRPHGTWVATTLYTTPQWNNSEDINHDMAAAVVAPLNGRRLTDVVGGQGVAFNQARRQQMHSFGYPAAAPYDGSKLIYCSGRAFDDFLMTRDLGLSCNMTGGSSGGPWFLSFNESTGLGTQNSVNSFKYNFAANWMFGPYFGPEARAVYQAAQTTGTP